MFNRLTKYIRNNSLPLAVSIICSYALYLRFVFLYRHVLGEDELFQLSYLQGTFLGLFKSIPGGGPGPFLSGDYFLVYPFFKIFSFNKWGLAIPHIIATIIGFYILYLICKKYLSSLGTVIVFVVICFNETLIGHATEIRPYAVLPTLALAIFYLFQRIAGSGFNLSSSKRVFDTGIKSLLPR